MLKNLVKKFTSHSLNDDVNTSSPLARCTLTSQPADDVDDDARSALSADSGAALSIVSNATRSSSGGYSISSSNAHTHRGHASSALNAGQGSTKGKRGGTAAHAGSSRRTQMPPPLTHTVSTRRAVAAAAAASSKNALTSSRRSGTRNNNNSQSDAHHRRSDSTSVDSDDEELAIIDTNSIKSVPVSLTSDYYTSQQSLSASCRSSHCGSPSFDQDLISWDSFGCDSGASLRNITAGLCNSAADQVEPLEVELPYHHYHTRQQFKRFVKYQQKQQISFATAEEDVDDAKIEEAITDHSCFSYQEDCQPQHHSEISTVITRQSLRSLDHQHQVSRDNRDLPSIDECQTYNQQLASPSSSIDELESINGNGSTENSTLTPANEKKKDATLFRVPDSNFIRRHTHSNAKAGAKIGASITGNTSKGFSLTQQSHHAEKRKWSQVQSSDYQVGWIDDAEFPDGAFRGYAGSEKLVTSGGTALRNQDDLLDTEDQHVSNNGGRRAPVRLLVAPPNNEILAMKNCGAITDIKDSYAATLPAAVSLLSGGLGTASAKSVASPRKKCRSSPKYTLADGVAERQRPSLNFEKMRREKLKNKAGRKKYRKPSTVAMKSKLRGWNAGYQLRSSSNGDCLFQPLKFPPSPSCSSQQPDPLD